MQEDYNLLHVYNWIQFFVSLYNDTLFETYFIIEMQEKDEFIFS